MTYEILYRFRPDGTLRGSHVRDWADDGKSAGPARRMTQADLDAIGSTLDLGHVRRIEELLAEIERLKTEHAEEIKALREEHARQLDAAQGARAGSADAQLAELYATLPPEIQIAFAPTYATVASLMDRGRTDLAAAYVANLPVAAELVPLRDQFAGILAPSAQG